MLENLENLTSLISEIEKNWNADEYDFGIILEIFNDYCSEVILE